MGPAVLHWRPQRRTAGEAILRLAEEADKGSFLCTADLSSAIDYLEPKRVGWLLRRLGMDTKIVDTIVRV